MPKRLPSLRAAPPSVLDLQLAIGLGLSLGLFLLCAIASLSWGAADISPATIFDAFLHFDPAVREHLIIRTVRLPRSLVGAAVGAALAVAGGIMQGLTRNPLASPGILGVNAGASLAVVGATLWLGALSPSTAVWFAFAGAGLTATVVYAVASLGSRSMTPLKLTLAGATLAALLSAIVSGMLVLNQRTLEEIRFWLAGSLIGRDFQSVWQGLVYIAVGLAIALTLGKPITVLNLGEDIARSLGQATGRVKGVAVATVALLAGSAVAIAGPIGFVGLVVPNAVRLFIKFDYRWILIYSALFGSSLLLLADLGARTLVPSGELPVGTIVALVGAPFFIYLVRWKVE
ncbi:iron ABC transporter permease [Synechococcus sp. PCC 7336]|uniref:FecCD family ABC transporter permease n=1 Tax=Synechococcus sp. PCC 7336 TaxID=195250 RepID=UPI000346AF01|nr:iron ABC transporter permease [Synechococcus sp. PCC 7336]